MRVATIGSGNVGSGLAKILSEAGLSTVVGARDTAKARHALESIGAKAAVAVPRDAVANADVIFIAVPYAEVGSVLDQIGDVTGKVIVDVTNPLTPDYMGLTVGHTTSAAEEIQKRIPGARVVKAFNTVFAQIYANGPKIKGVQVPVFIAGDDEDATRKVEMIASRLGFAPILVGGLTVARYLEPLAGLNIRLGYGRGWGTAIAPTWMH